MFVAQFQTFLCDYFVTYFIKKCGIPLFRCTFFFDWREFKIKDLSEYHIITCKFGITLEGENNYVVFGLW